MESERQAAVGRVGGSRPVRGNGPMESGRPVGVGWTAGGQVMDGRRAGGGRWADAGRAVGNRPVDVRWAGVAWAVVGD